MLKEISIEIIRKCPNKCLHCSSFSSEKCSEIIPFDLFKNVIIDAVKAGLKRVCFSGGEPFLHPYIVEMVRFVSEQKLESYIYSSGVYMDARGERASIPPIILEGISKYVTKIIYNIEGADEAVYDTIMGTKGCFILLKKSIISSVEKGICVEGHFVPNKINKNQIEKTLILCDELNVSKVSFLRLVMHGRAQENFEQLYLSEEETKEVEQILYNIKNSNRFSIRIGVPFFGETEDYHCEAASGKLNIRYDGKVFPCEVFKNNKVYSLSGVEPCSIYDMPLYEIYNDSEYLKKARRVICEFACSHSCENCVGQYYINKGLGE